MQREYRNVVFTDHALQRLKKRRITQTAVINAINTPDEQETEVDGDCVFKKRWQGRRYHVVAMWLADEGKWLVKSAWVRGEEDRPVGWVVRLLAAVRLIRKAVRHERKPRRS